jgi:Domain of unknown function (DUF3597)
MSIFDSIMSKIFHRGAGTGSAGVQATATGQAGPGTTTPTSSAAATPVAAVSGATPSVPQASVDVEAVLNQMASKSGQRLDWRHSIVDLMKLLNLDSSLSARKQLAEELHYTWDMNDSAKMNIWLHKQVMRKLAENGGKVPEELKT